MSRTAGQLQHVAAGSKPLQRSFEFGSVNLADVSLRGLVVLRVHDVLLELLALAFARSRNSLFRNRARETVECDTPATCAISSIEIVRRRILPQTMITSNAHVCNA